MIKSYPHFLLVGILLRKVRVASNCFCVVNLLIAVNPVLRHRICQRTEFTV